MFRKFATVFAACILGGFISSASGQTSETAGKSQAASQDLVPGTGAKVSYAADIRPLFRAKDIASMKKNGHFDLSLYSDVAAKAIDILGQLEKGGMPCDGAWPQSDVDKFKQWIKDGKQP